MSFRFSIGQIGKHRALAERIPRCGGRNRKLDARTLHKLKIFISH